MQSHSDVLTILDEVQRFLIQQGQLFGNDFIVSKKGETSASVREKAPTLADFYHAIKDCQKCPLGRTRTNFVFGVGNPHAEFMLIGEAPGYDEDRQGEPFVGKAGQLLNKILQSIEFRREEVYIANIIKCRPPNNRDPLPEEIEKCEPYLWTQIDLIKPKVILALGRIAGQTLLKVNQPLAVLRGKVHEVRGIKLVVTYHPAALLRNPQWKRQTWEDVQLLRKVYNEVTTSAGPNPHPKDRR